MIRAGVIGAGVYGSLHLSALKEREVTTGDVILAGFAEVDDSVRVARASEFDCPGYSDYQQLIENEQLDAITVATPDHLHFDIAMACIRRGIPLLVEKPLSTRTDEARTIAETARDANVFLQVDFHKRFDPYHIDVRMRILEKEIGALQYGYFWIEDVLDVGTGMIGKKSWGTQGSPVWFLGIHAVDLSLWMMDFPKATEVYAKGFSGKLRSLGIDIYDSVKATVSYDNGVTITYDTSVILPNSYEARVHQGLKILGTEGILEVDTQYRGARHCVSSKGMETPNLGGKHRIYNKDRSVGYRGYLFEAILDFVDNIKMLKAGTAIDDLQGTFPSGVEAIESTRICEAIHTAIVENKVINP